MLKRRDLVWVLALACALPACSSTAPQGAKSQNEGGDGSGATGLGAAAGMSSSGAATGGAEVAGSGAGAGAGGATTGGSTFGGAASAGSGGGPWTFPVGVTKPRIMIVGDSISAGPGCYKKYLLKNLNDNGYTSFEFVGEYTDDCGGGVRHSAVSCSTAEQYTMPQFTMPNCSQDKTFPGMSTLVTTHRPDLVMLQLGVNDVWNAKPVSSILANYATLVEQARAQNPKVVLVVAQIHKIAPSCMAGDPVTALAEQLVMAVPAWARGVSTPDSPVFVADLWTSSDWSKAEAGDCVHPNDVGAMRMGKNWYEALEGILKPD